MKKSLLYYILHPDHLLVVLFTLLLMRFIVFIALDISFLNPIERSLENFNMTDVFYDIYRQGEVNDTSDLITIVDIADVSKRGELADIITELDMMEPAVLGVDIIFNRIREDSAGNAMLLSAVRNVSTPTVWAKKLDKWDDNNGEFTDDIRSFFADSLSINEGYINIHNDQHGEAVRYFGTQRQLLGKTEYSMPLKVAMELNGDSSLFNYTDDINIRYTKTTFPVVPYNELAENYDLISGHIVLLGSKSDPRDQSFTPLGLIPGVEILAYTIQTITERKMPEEWSSKSILLLTILLMWLVQVIRYLMCQLMFNSQQRWVRDFGECDFAGTLLNIMVVFVLVGFSFYHFVHNNVYINMAWAIAGIAMLEFSRKLYFLLISSLCYGLKIKFLRHSLAHDNWEERQPYFKQIHREQISK
jgi:CHASE2 domain-containing sensor protein